jgi:hypothetical protein
VSQINHTIDFTPRNYEWLAFSCHQASTDVRKILDRRANSPLPSLEGEKPKP